jgi:hypothetical protein
MVTDSGETIQVPANTAHGTASWLAESGSFSPSDETFAQLSLGAYKASTKIIVSEELLQDSAFDLEAYLAREFGERLGVLENTAFIKGDGSGKPQGLLTSNTASNLGSDVTAATGNATSFNYTALVTSVFSLPRQYRANASFIVSDQSARNLYLMVDSQNRPLWNVNVSPRPARTRSSATRSTPIRICLRLAPATCRRCSATGSACTRFAVSAGSACSVRTSCTAIQRPGRFPRVRACGRPCPARRRRHRPQALRDLVHWIRRKGASNG